tara:strand:- start:2331 stop:2774 length:444 start_codon:yes stop_codon:yes gene_type:complete
MSTKQNYTEESLLYYLEENSDLKGVNGRKRHILDRRNYIMHILYCKFGKTEKDIASILKIKRCTVQHSKYHAYFWKEDIDFKLNTERIRKAFPYSAQPPDKKKEKSSKKHKMTVQLTHDEYVKLTAFRKTHNETKNEEAIRRMIRIY